MQQINDLRRRLAVITGLILDNIRATSVYSFDDSSYFFFSFVIKEERYSIYDYYSSCYVSGNHRRIYDYATSSYVSVNKKLKRLSFYSYGFNRYINAVKNGRIVTLYDYGDSSYHQYRL